MKHSLLLSSLSFILPLLSFGASKLCSAPLLTLDRSELLALFLSCFTLLHFISKSLPSYQPFSSASYRILFFTVSVMNAQNLILLSWFVLVPYTVPSRVAYHCHTLHCLLNINAVAITYLIVTCFRSWSFWYFWSTETNFQSGRTIPSLSLCDLKVGCQG
jgi:hypothetical protein